MVQHTTREMTDCELATEIRRREETLAKLKRQQERRRSLAEAEAMTEESLVRDAERSLRVQRGGAAPGVRAAIIDLTIRLERVESRVAALEGDLED